MGSTGLRGSDQIHVGLAWADQDIQTARDALERARKYGFASDNDLLFDIWVAARDSKRLVLDSQGSGRQGTSRRHPRDVKSAC
jgi:hypothetical protein